MNGFDLSAFLSTSENAVIVDVRDTALFKEGFIPGSIHVPLKAKQFTEWVTAVLDNTEPVLLVSEPGDETAAAQLLGASGFTVAGWLEGGFESYKNSGAPVDMIIDVETDELMMDIPFDEHLVVMDVRKPIEFAEGHLKDAVNLPLNNLTDPLRIAAIEEHDNLYLHCGGGTRSVIAASVLKRQGIHNLRNVAGGWKKIKEEPRAQIVKEPGMLN
ncbi:rhodanese-like domain-containing protein [Niabella soli]|uniref:Beta-lactamase n=1 Tax=Niabella soli DSM 19437 TaxID=929713 RepID=W0F3U7_9BACT|nr:rhodanese-like domain-containing protein [Niabella soli]AHF16493.1 beta-lactamase [Niabella soli DSM 19437]